MKIFLSGVDDSYLDLVNEDDKIFILNTFASIVNSTSKAKAKTFKLIQRADDFLLDSGAFTFMYKNAGKYTNVDWDSYIKQYAQFIVDYDVKKFFELDIDGMIGYDNVLKLREKLENLTGKQCIPVWHPTRGKDDFVKMCKSYQFVAVGGLVGGIGNLHKYDIQLPMLIDEAHRHGAKIHGLGFTSIKKIPSYHFDTVDSTSWLSGQYGTSYCYLGNGQLTSRNFDGKHYINGKNLHKHNFKEWLKYIQYAYKYL